MQKSLHQLRQMPLGEREALINALNNGIATLGWGKIGDVRNKSYEQTRDLLGDQYGLYGRSVSASLSAIWHLCHDVHIGDYIITPDGETIHIGEVTREYYYSDGSEDPIELRGLIEHTAHRIGVRWFQKTFSRSDLSDELRSSLRNQRTYSCLNSFIEEIRSLVQPGAVAEVTSISLTAKIILNGSTEISISGLPRNLDEANQNALFDAIRSVYRK